MLPHSGSVFPGNGAAVKAFPRRKRCTEQAKPDTWVRCEAMPRKCALARERSAS
jgi:hypothetical protein